MSRYVVSIISLLSIALTMDCSRARLNRSAAISGRPESAAEVEDVRVFGFQVLVIQHNRNFRGELIAVDSELLWLLEQNEILYALRLSATRKVIVQPFPAEAGKAGLWTGLGVLSTLSHGWYFIFTAPVWLLGGITSTVFAATSDEVTVSKPQFIELHQFARFPEGPPDAFLAQFKGFERFMSKSHDEPPLNKDRAPDQTQNTP